MSESETIAMVEAAGLNISPHVAAGFRPDGDLGRDLVSRTARLAVAAWALAVNGDEATLAGLAPPQVRHFLLHPAMEKWVVAPGPQVSEIEVRAFEAAADPPRLGVRFQFAGRQRFDDPGRPEEETLFVGLLDLLFRPGDQGGWPWELSSGHISTLDKYLGYVFTSRRESAEEYYRRTAAAETQPRAAAQTQTQAQTGPPPAGRRFLIVAGFAEHDERLGSSASIEVELDAPPTRYEAVELVWPAVWDQTVASLGEGDWRPSLNWVDLIELLNDDPERPGGPG